MENYIIVLKYCKNERCENCCAYTTNPTDKKFKNYPSVKKKFTDILDVPEGGRCPLCGSFLTSEGGSVEIGENKQTVPVKEVQVRDTSKVYHVPVVSEADDGKKDDNAPEYHVPAMPSFDDDSEEDITPVKRITVNRKNNVTTGWIGDNKQADVTENSVKTDLSQSENGSIYRKQRRILNTGRNSGAVRENINSIEKIVSNCFEKNKVIGMKNLQTELSTLYRVMNQEDFKDMQGKASAEDLTIRNKHFLISGGSGEGKDLTTSVMIDLLEDFGIRKKNDKKLLKLSELKNAIQQDDFDKLLKDVNGGVIYFDKNIDELFRQGDSTLNVDYGICQVLGDLMQGYAGKCTFIFNSSIECGKIFYDYLRKSGNETYIQRLDITGYTNEERFLIIEKILQSKENISLDEEAADYIRKKLEKEKFSVDHSFKDYVFDLCDNIRKKHVNRINEMRKMGESTKAEEDIYTLEDVKEDTFGEKFDLEKKLSEIVGMENVKQIIRTQYIMLQADKKREEAHSEVDTTQSLNMIFEGKPGTGKTTIARVMADMFCSMGILKKRSIVEVHKADLVAGYEGQTAIKTENVFKSAIGGVLFIDEAYSITNGGSSFGQECVDTLVKLIEDYRGEIIVILAGYSKEMKDFMKTNSGLESRFPLVVEFPDYSSEELYTIGLKMIAKRGFILNDESKKALKKEISDQKKISSEKSSNGRMVRNIVDEIIRKQSVRVVKEGVPKSEINLIVLEDIKGDDKLKKFNLEEALSKIIGLSPVKDFVRTQYKMCVAAEKRRKADLDVDTTQALNMVFIGNPGTGKTTVARIMADMFFSMGILKKDNFIEAHKADLVAEYEGQTAPKTENMFKSAIGGVLFIDEAYSITNNGSSFGQECVDTLVKLIEDHQGEIIVILAGYSREMRAFLKANSGLKSRFPLEIEFPDYSAAELFEIGKQMIISRGFSLSDSAEVMLEEEIVKLKKRSKAESGNGRMVRNFVEDIVRHQSTRIADTDVEGSALTEIIVADIAQDSEKESVFDMEKELSTIIGLESVKNYMRSLNAELKTRVERKKAGLKTDDVQTMHMIFAGNPGTGKTMMARTVANILYNINVISSNKLVEADRSKLVAGYEGQTAIKTRELIETALDGVLFIDEAYALAQGGENDFGQEAIDTLVKMMDDYRDRLVVILAGYNDAMKRFLDKNDGLASRFSRIINFSDYSLEELMQIAKNMYSENDYILSAKAEETLKNYLEEKRKESHFGNGRSVRNAYEASKSKQASRLYSTYIEQGKEIPIEELKLIKAEDIIRRQ